MITICNKIIFRRFVKFSVSVPLEIIAAGKPSGFAVFIARLRVVLPFMRSYLTLLN